MVKVKVIQPFEYAGRMLRRGEFVEVDEKIAIVWRHLGKVINAPAKGRYRRRDMKAET